MKSLKRFFEPKLFGVCTAIADRFSMPLSLVRLFFRKISIKSIEQKGIS